MKMPEHEPIASGGNVSKEWLIEELLRSKSKVVMLDCRGSNEFGDSHIRHAVNFSIPSIMLRRLAAGKIDLMSTIRCKELKEEISHAYTDKLFVVYSDAPNENDIVQTLVKRLLKDGCRAVCLEDGFLEFRRAYPEWCESCGDSGDTPDASGDVSLGSGDGGGGLGAGGMPLMGLRSLRISSNVSNIVTRHQKAALPSSSTEDSSSDSEHAADIGFDDDKDFPVEIVSYLYLGNAANSEDLESLSRHGIQYVLNVTPDLPNKFENSGGMKYMQIPIADHWSQNLASFFPKAIQFIDEGRSQKKGVLVHCLAGVSRSVTITVAYLMSHMSLSLNDAFGLVRSRKSNVGPNFHFMEQLHAFERELTRKDSGISEGDGDTSSLATPDGGKKCVSCGTLEDEAKGCSRCAMTAALESHFASPLTIFGQSPDSGIEFDRWTPGTGE